MATQTLDHQCSSDTKASVVHKSQNWTHVVVSLSSVVIGSSNAMQIKGSYIEVEPGQVLSFLMGPGDELRFKSTGSTPTRWSLVISELNFIDDIIGLLCRLGGQ